MEELHRTRELIETKKSRRDVSAKMSLLDACGCKGSCCVGRTVATNIERRRIVQSSGSDHFIHWRRDLYYLERGQCPYLEDGLCSVQEVKPFACLVYPFVPRVVEGELWLYRVSECSCASRLPDGFQMNAVRLAKLFFSGRELSEYEEYWNENKVGDFDEDHIIEKVRVAL